MLNEQVLPIVDWAPWVLATIVEIFVACLLVVRGLLRRFLFLALYLMVSVASSIGRYAVLSHFGQSSDEYRYFYYYSDAVLTIALFLAICELGLRLVREKQSRRTAAALFACALGGTVLFTYVMELEYFSHSTTTFAYELSINLYLVCSGVVFGLWMWKVKNQDGDWIAKRIVNVLSVYFLLYLLCYVVVQFGPRYSDLGALTLMTGAWLPFGCGFAVVSQE